MTHQVIISLAANRFQKTNLSKARCCLEEILSDLQFTDECWTEPVGNATRHDAYLNQLAKGTTEMDEETLNAWLKQTEQHFGRTDAKRRLGIVPIDLDLLLFDGEQRHQRDWQRNYVKNLICQLKTK
jgi:2-amino-4-hydroxy-6-hydroxymethyldihydropteridine diphosphokinase